MKRVLFVLVTIVMGLFLFFSIQSTYTSSQKMLFKQTLYSQMTTDRILRIEGFSNSKTLYTESEAIESIYISSLDERYKLLPVSYQIEPSGTYEYLGDTYTRYIYKLELPEIEIDYYIKSCYLNILLKNGEILKASIGRLSLMKPSDMNDFSIYNQYGMNSNEGHFLTTVVLDIVTKRPIQIESVCYTVNHCVELNISIEQQKTIEISLETDVYYYQQTALKIIYSIEGTLYSQTVDTFKYFEHMTNVIPENSLNRIYVID